MVLNEPGTKFGVTQVEHLTQFGQLSYVRFNEAEIFELFRKFEDE